MHDSPDDDDDDDDVSLVSRSPSPRPSDAMDVDGSLDKYDEYVRGPSREVITVDTKLKPTNKGFALLAKLGWVEGQPVGLSGEGEYLHCAICSVCRVHIVSSRLMTHYHQGAPSPSRSTSNRI